MIPRAHVLAIGVLILIAAGVSVAFYGVLPETVPTHWDIHGNVDSYGSKWELLLLGPCLGLGLALFLGLMPLLGPLRRNVESFRTVYGRLCVLVVAMILAIHVIALLKGSGHSMPIGRAMAIILGIMIAVMGNWLGKLRRNFWIGIRTPWTLLSDVVWERTHRLGGRLFVVAGLLSALAGLLLPGWLCFWVMIGSICAASLITTIYSIICYRRYAEPHEITWNAAADQSREQAEPRP